MALTVCRECNGSVSTEAAACPGCGGPPARFVPEKKASWPRTRGQKAAAGILAGAAGLWFLVQASGGSSTGATAKTAAYQNDASPVPATSPPAPNPQPVVAETPSPPPPPSHNFSVEQDGEYGYESAISDSDRQAGTAMKPLVMVRYLGEPGGTTRFAMVDGGTRTVFTCKEACEVVKGTVYFDGQQVSQQTMRVAPGSVMSAVVEDIQAGQLQVYRKK